MTAELRASAGSNTGAQSRISKEPLIGVLAVLIGVNISVMAGRLLTVSLPDLRGVLGIGIDEASWIPTALLGAQMFAGPMSVAAGAIWGHRKVLRVSAAVYVWSSLVSPLVPNWHALIFLQIVRGLSSGTFYPLTLNFVTQNLPRPWIVFGLAAYALDVLGSNHLSYPLYSFYHQHATWHWIFWNSIPFTIAMLVCIHLGIPVQKPLPEYHKMRFLDFLYASAGLTFLYVGLDQGERCDWFNSGMITGLFIAGISLLILAAFSRMRTPNPLLDFRHVKDRNVLLMSYVLTVYFVALLGTFTLVPIFLSQLHFYRPAQAIPIALPSGVLSLLVAPLAAALLKVIDARLVAAVGFLLMAVGFFGEAHLISTWQWREFFGWQMLISIGNPIALVPSLALFLFAGFKPGESVPVVRGYTNGAYFQTVRLFFSEAGGSVMQRFLLTREHLWRTILVSHVNGNWQSAERLSVLTAAMIPNAAGLAPASERAIALLTGNVLRQAQSLAIADGFMVLGCFTVTTLFVIALLHPVHIPGTSVAEVKQPGVA